MHLVQPPPKIVERAYVTGLTGQDDNIDVLAGYFKEMQKTTVETAQPDDFLSFSGCAHFFGVIMLETTTIPVEEELVESDEEEDVVPLQIIPRAPEPHSEEAEDSVYPASSRATTPPGSSTSSAASFHTTRLGVLEALSTPSENSVPTMSDHEKVLLWKEAFDAKLEQTSNDSPLPPRQSNQSHEQDVRPTYLSKGKFPEYRSGYLSHDQPETEPLLNRIQGNDDEDISDLINWPDEGPSDVAPHRQEHVYDTADFPMDISSPQPWQDDLGREFLESEVYSSSTRALVEPPSDPEVQAFIYESAIRYQEELRSRTIKEYQMSKRREQMREEAPPAPPAEPTKRTAPIGLIYLWTSQTLMDPLHMGECTLGIYIIPEQRSKDCLVDAIIEVVDLAFRDPECHRLQSIIVENPDKLYNLDLLARAGFRNEGMRRRAFYSNLAHEWKDVTYFAMLDTDWVYDQNNSPDSRVRLRPRSLWEEVFARHQKECDDLITLEEKSGLKRSSSIETIRERATSSAASFYAESERGGDTTDTSLSIYSAASWKRRKTGAHPTPQIGTPMSVETNSVASASSSGLDSDWEALPEPGPSTQRNPFVTRSLGSSNAGVSKRLKRSGGGARSGSSASSSWSLLSD